MKMITIKLVFFALFAFIGLNINAQSVYEVKILTYEKQLYKTDFNDTVQIPCGKTYIARPMIISTDSIFVNDFEQFVKDKFPPISFFTQKVDSTEYSSYLTYLSSTITFQNDELISISCTNIDDGRDCYGGTGHSSYKYPFTYYIPKHKIITIGDVFKEDWQAKSLYLKALTKDLAWAKDEVYYESMIAEKWKSIICNPETFRNIPILISEKGITFFYEYSGSGFYDILSIFMSFEEFKEDFEPWILNMVSKE